jgi:hypothetical protein
MTHIASFCAGAIVALLFALWMMTRRKPPIITKPARKPVDVPCQERKYRGKETTVVVPSWREDGVRYEFMNMTGMEDK